MSGEIRDWLADLRDSNPRAATRVTHTVAALMGEGASLGDPLVLSTAGAWPGALADALHRSYPEELERMTTVRQAVAAAATLVKDIQDRAAELGTAMPGLQDRHRQAVEVNRPHEAAQAASDLAAAQREAAELQRLLPAVTDARDRLAAISQRTQARVDALRTRKEVLKATYTAAQGTIRVHQAIAAAGPAGDDHAGQPQDAGDAIIAAHAELADVTARMERELGTEGWPEGLTELRPGAPVHSDIRILFAIEPPATTVLIAVLDGPDVAEEQFPEALMASADMLRRMRAGQAPEAVIHGYDSPQAFLEEFAPGHASEPSARPASPDAGEHGGEREIIRYPATRIRAVVSEPDDRPDGHDQ